MRADGHYRPLLRRSLAVLQWGWIDPEQKTEVDGRETRRRLPSSPVREHGRGRTWHGDPKGSERTPSSHGDPRRRRVEKRQPRTLRVWICTQERSFTHHPGGEGELQDFWGQHWFTPNSNPSPSKARVREPHERLVWIRRELWNSKSFTQDDCFLASAGDAWVGVPRKLKFAELCWGDAMRESFVAIVKGSMANRGRDRGPRPRSSDGDWVDWGGGGGWNQFPPNPYPPPQPPGQFFNPLPPPPFGYFPNQMQQPPPQANYGQYNRGGGIRPRGGGRGRNQMGRGQQRNENNQANRAPKSRRNGDEDKAPTAEERVLKEDAEVKGNQQLNVVCYNCGEIGHFSSGCTKPKVCFICHQTDHVVEHCSE